MMKLLNLITSLLPSFKRDEVVNEVKALREDLEENTIPVFEALVKEPAMKKSKVVQEFDKDLQRGLNGIVRGNFAEITNVGLGAVRGLISYLENAVEKTFSRDIIVAGLTYRKAEILRLIMYVDFFVTYTRQNALYLLAVECNADTKSFPPGKERPLPEIKWLLENRAAYIQCFKMLMIKPSEIDRMLQSLPEIVINQENDQINAAIRPGTMLDPLGGNFINIHWNPFYAMGVRRANKRHARTQRAKNEKRAIMYRIEQLHRLNRGEQSPDLEKTISIYEQEVDRLAAQIAKDEVI